MFGTYSISLWDHDAQTFSGELAAAHLERPSTGLTIGDLKLALRTLYGAGWSDLTMYAKREDGDGLVAKR